MKSSLWIKNLFIFILVVAEISACDNITVSGKRTEVDNDIKEFLSKDEYILEAGKSCKAGYLSGCIQGGAGSVILDLMHTVGTTQYNNEEPVNLVKTSLPSQQQFGNEHQQRSSEQSGFFGFLTRAADRYLRTTGIVFDLNDEITEGGLYKPRFIDEVYTEIDTLEDKNAKPHRKEEFKKLFIPLLVILKLFKLKLLIFLPILFGLASFKKIIALLIIILPGIFTFFKLCKPDLGHSYGSFGHSSFYNSPPSAKRQPYEEMMQHYNSRIGNKDYAHNLVYQSYRHQRS